MSDLTRAQRASEALSEALAALERAERSITSPEPEDLPLAQMPSDLYALMGMLNRLAKTTSTVAGSLAEETERLAHLPGLRDDGKGDRAARSVVPGDTLINAAYHLREAGSSSRMAATRFDLAWGLAGRIGMEG